MAEYKVRCYSKSGNLQKEVYAASMEEAKAIRTDHGLSIGLKPEPSMDFARYPTIWKLQADGSYERVAGY